MIFSRSRHIKEQKCGKNGNVLGIKAIIRDHFWQLAHLQIFVGKIFFSQF